LSTEPAGAEAVKPIAEKPIPEQSVPDGMPATSARRPRPSPRPAAAAPETAKSTASPAETAKSTASTAPAASATVAASDRVVPRHANSARPHVEVIPVEPAAGHELLLKRLAPFAILVMILLLRRRATRRSAGRRPHPFQGPG
jgi:hypothetical protein